MAVEETLICTSPCFFPEDCSYRQLLECPEWDLLHRLALRLRLEIGPCLHLPGPEEDSQRTVVFAGLHSYSHSRDTEDPRKRSSVFFAEEILRMFSHAARPIDLSLQPSFQDSRFLFLEYGQVLRFGFGSADFQKPAGNGR